VDYMDTITHTLLGLTIYAAIDKEEMSKGMKRSILFTSVVGSQIPDIDVVSRLWDTEGMYQMWHRGITHSIFLVPIWAFLLFGLCYLFWRVKDRRIFYIGILAVFIHITIDSFNAWGTGYFEPISARRITFGTIPIIDFAIWGIMLMGLLITQLKGKLGLSKLSNHKVFKAVGLLILLHVMVQSAQGYMIYQSYEERYEQHTLAATFVPWKFTVIGKEGGQVEILDTTVWGKPTSRYQLTSSEEANLEMLFEQNPRAKTLYMWSPFVVIVDDEERLGIYDPRFYREGQSFLFEYIEKKGID
jgi:inner membrane protein